MNHILVVDDEKNYLIVLSALLSDAGYKVSAVDNPFAALDLLSREPVSLVLSDLKMPRMDGLEFFRRVQQEYGPLPFVILTAFATVETAIEAIKAGVFDYLMKPFNNEEILLTVAKALDFSRLQRENASLKRQLELSRKRDLVGDSPPIRQLLGDIARVAPARTSIMIMGESGSGKELVARMLHDAGPRAAGPLVTVNCATFTENLLESELFGHERGAFTGAVERKQGLLEIANGGTLFLDEIGEFPLTLQPKLLRVIQERRFRRVGGTVELETDVRLVAATNRDLRAMVEEGRFREDLYYRLNVVTLTVPPLRERGEDIALLALYFLRRFAHELGREVSDIAPEALAIMQQYTWPGNVRELQNAMERGVLFCKGATLQVEDLPANIQPEGASGPLLPVDLSGGDKSLPELMEDVERQLIHGALVRARGVQAQAAQLLGISRSNLQYKLKKYGLL
jgi:DNA-binding NtrC family response regulator